MTADNPAARVDLEHSHETGGAWHVTRWEVPGCAVCELDAVRFEAIGAGGLRSDVVSLEDAKRILAERLAPLLAELKALGEAWDREAEWRKEAEAERDEARAERDYWQRQAEGFLRAATADLGRYHRLRERVEALETCPVDQCGPVQRGQSCPRQVEEERDAVAHRLTGAQAENSHLADLLAAAEAKVAEVEALAERYEADAESEDYAGELWSTTAAAIRAALADPEAS